MDWTELFDQETLSGADKLVNEGAVRDLHTERNRVTATVKDNEEYRVEIALGDTEIESMHCNCAVGNNGKPCSHEAAVLIACDRKFNLKNQSTSDQNAVEESVEEEVSHNTDLSIDCQIDDELAFASVNNGFHFVHTITIRNNSSESISNLRMCISSLSDLIVPYEIHIEELEAGEEHTFHEPDVIVNTEKLASLTECFVFPITVAVAEGNQPLVSETRMITALAYDEWPGLKHTPELLAAFVTPNHPVVASLLQRAGQYLGKKTGDPSLAGYQMDDPNRVIDMATAAYAAIQMENITYAEPPASFESTGQRIRLADAIIDQHLGTCMDLTLLYAACLEAMGLNPFLVMMNGHIFAGVWLIDQSFPDMIMDDPSQLEKRMTKGLTELIVVECTAMCAGMNMNFDDAVQHAKNSLAHYSDYQFTIDVKRARSMGIRPLPLRIKTDNGFQVEHENRSSDEITNTSSVNAEIYDIDDTVQEKATKLQQWERKLLDFSLRNALINLRPGKSIVMLLTPDIAALEDVIEDGERFRVLPRPAEMAINGDKIQFESLKNLGPFEDFIRQEANHSRLHSISEEDELTSTLTRLYRNSRTSLEESGAATLFLALGVLRWYEKNKTPRYAPIVLVPVDISRKSGKGNYSLSMRDEDASINITILEFLKQTFNLEIHGLTPPPKDEHGLDISRIFAIIRKGIMNMPMCDVIEVGVLGNFSFSKFVMWNDVHSNPDFLGRNNIVHSLMEGRIDWDCSIPENIDESDAVLPVSVDSSQLHAINMAAGGVSFVLHGPPGTGKSQTITAMIANALSKGKRVLFVAEKMAALEVVQKRLATLGIGDYCLELHSNKATKKSVLDQLDRSLSLTKQDENSHFDMKTQQVREMRKELDAYSAALNKVRPFGKTLRQMIDLYEALPETDQTVIFPEEEVSGLTEEMLDQQRRALERLITAGKGIGHPHNHPLRSVHLTEYSQKLKLAMGGLVQPYIDSLKKIQEDSETFAELIQRPVPRSENEWTDFYFCSSAIQKVKEIPSFLRNYEDLDKAFYVPEAYLEKEQNFQKKHEEMLAKWTDTFLKMDMNHYLEEYANSNKKLFGKGRAIKALQNILQSFAHFEVIDDQIPLYLSEVTAYQQEEKKYEEEQEKLPYEWKKILEEYPTAEALNKYKEVLKKQQKVDPRYKTIISDLLEKGMLDQAKNQAETFIRDLNVAAVAEKNVISSLKLRLPKNSTDWIGEKISLCESIAKNADLLKNWTIYQELNEECRKIGLGPICDAYDAGLDHDQVMNVYLRSIYQAIILSVIEGEPALNSFTGYLFNTKIAEFKRLDNQYMKLAEEEVQNELSANLPNDYENSDTSRQLNILRRAISSNGRGLSIRQLFSEIWDVLVRLKPCMLMSPLSVAQYLEPKDGLFDIVVFDEASQMPTCQAVGAIARGTSAVIVGDPNQMPPTSFFETNVIDENNLDIEDLESILDDCLALGMPSAYLHWHYRSRHESLIAFSNEEFYENQMTTFPSVNDREKHVHLEKLEGSFKRGGKRVNEAEAKAIVQEIIRRFKDPELQKKSIGVVTFNANQQTLIEDLLNDEFDKNFQLENWATSGEEPLFIKNLENVQGDERDVILFSVTYGPDENGKMSMNFGPLNRDGGWRRLNVAVSRAREEMIVFTIMTPEMIDSGRSKKRGVEALRDFLSYAKNGSFRGERKETSISKNEGILRHICKELTAANYQYQMNVGHSRFKVDIAVINPYKPEEYLMGILFDGDSYGKIKNTRDREVSQIEVLNGLGWHLYRVWTMDWWEDRDKELAGLMEALEKRKEEAHQDYLAEQKKQEEKEKAEEAKISETKQVQSLPKSDSESENQSPQQKEMVSAYASLPKDSSALKAQTVQRHYQAVEYQEADLEYTPMNSSEFTDPGQREIICERMMEIINAEAPIAESRLIRRTLRSFGIMRASSLTTEAAEQAIKELDILADRHEEETIFWRTDQNPEAYWIFRQESNPENRRSGSEICRQEMKNAICLTIEKEGALSREELIKAVIRFLGFKRSGTPLKMAVEVGIRYGMNIKELSVNNDLKVILNEESR